MVRRSLVLGFLASCLSLSALACGGEEGGAAIDPQAPDTQEAEVGARAKFTRLDRATKDEVADTFEATIAKQIGEVLAANPSIRTFNRRNVLGLRVDNRYYLELGELIETLLDELDQQSIAPSTVERKARAWALAKLEAHVGADGFVKASVADAGSMALSSAWSLTEETNAIEAAKAPRGVDIALLRQQWTEVEIARGDLDSRYLRPVTVDREPTVAAMAKHYGLRASLEAWGWDAIDQMASAGEGPNGLPQFRPIAETLKHAVGIKKRFFLTGGGEGWSTHVLLVLDEKNQLWGFQMGYSE